MQPKVVIYLHGFNSSPQSFKAQQTIAFFKKYYPNISLIVPQLALTPLAAWQQIDTIANEYQEYDIGFIGSSLGGFFATLLANKYHAPAVLINPAVWPHQIIDLLIGEYTNPYTGDIHHVTKAHGDELAALQFNTINDVESLWVLLQTEDETLDYRKAIICYEGARMTIEPQGDHSFVGFNRYLNSIVEFLFKNSP